jgi:hypothetical protein
MLHRTRRALSVAHPADNHISDDRPLPKPINALLREITYFEWACSRLRLKLPFGVSYLAIAAKT